MKTLCSASFQGVCINRKCKRRVRARDLARAEAKGQSIRMQNYARVDGKLYHGCDDFETVDGLHQLAISPRLKAILNNRGICTVAELTQYTREDLLGISDVVGFKSVAGIETALAELKLSLKSDDAIIL